MKLQAGDVFCSHGNMAVVSPLIRCAEKFWSKDNEAVYGHAGIITNSDGDTLEALWTVKQNSLEQYKGTKIIIARPLVELYSPDIINESQKLISIAAIKAKHTGNYYPAHRLLFHLFPPLAKYGGTGKHVVCSELVAKYLYLIKARQSPYLGVNPDTLADEWRRWRNFEIIFEGVL